MKKKFCLIFSALCMSMCVAPFACMTFARTDTTTENKRLAEMPSLVKDGKFQTDFLTGLGAYFDDHFAFRQQLVTADAQIQSNVFGVSNVETVVKGEDGWLYYTATLDDYLGRTLSERGIVNVAHNIDVMQDYVEDRGAKFLFTIAPNKSTLYGENMPYYDKEKISDTHNYELLTPLLAEQKTSYLDLFELFASQEETLYLKRDSHWDNRGALLAYDAMLDAMEHEHDDYSLTPALRTRTEIGDLNRMLYPLSSQPEWNVYYEMPGNYKYVTDTESVEDAWIETSNKKAEGSLLMYRDSFGNTLIPFMAEAFGDAYFSKLTPYSIGADMDRTAPQMVIVEKVERNIADFAVDPPVIPAPRVKVKGKALEGEKNARITLGESEANMDYMVFDGTLMGDSYDKDTKIFLKLTVGEKNRTYKVFYTSSEEGDFGFRAYLPKEALGTGTITARVLVKTDGKLTVAGEEEFQL